MSGKKDLVKRLSGLEISERERRDRENARLLNHCSSDEMDKIIKEVDLFEQRLGGPVDKEIIDSSREEQLKAEAIAYYIWALLRATELERLTGKDYETG